MNLTTCCLEQEGVIKYISEKQIKVAKGENDACLKYIPFHIHPIK